MKIHTLDLQFLQHPETIAAFLIESSDGLALVETGPHSTFHILEKAVENTGHKMADIRHVFISHIHFDHAGAAWCLADLGADIYVHPLGVKHLAEPSKLYNSAKMIYGDRMEELWGEMRPIAAKQLYGTEHGAQIKVGASTFTAWHTPGHAVHHVAWQLDDEVLFTGDVAGVRIENGPAMPPCPPPDINVEDWLKSIQLMRELGAEKFYLTHYGLITNKLAHLEDLEKRLLAWKEWMRPHFEQQTPMTDLVPLFEQFVASELSQNGVKKEILPQYESANPAYMSVSGLLRYWTKKEKS